MSTSKDLKSGPTMAITHVYPSPKSTVPVNKPVATDFPLFALLPAEIRENVWKQAHFEQPKVIEMIHPDLAASNSAVDNDVKADHRDLLGACYESRAVVGKELIMLPLGGGQQVRVDPLRDTIYFGPQSFLEDFEILPELSHWADYRNTRKWALHDFHLGQPLAHRITTNRVYGLHPLLNLSQKQMNKARHALRNIAICSALLLRTKRQRVFKQLFLKFKSCKGLTVITGDMGLHTFAHDDYILLKPDTIMNNLYDHVADRDLHDDNVLFPLYEGQSPSCSAHHSNEARVAQRAQNELRICSGAITLEYCPPHVQVSNERLVEFFRDQTNVIAVPLDEEEGNEIGYSVMCVRRGGVYYGHGARMDWDLDGRERMELEADDPDSGFKSWVGVDMGEGEGTWDEFEKGEGEEQQEEEEHN